MSQEPAIIHVSTPKSWRGGEQQMVYLVEELQQKGIRQCVVCPEGSAVANYFKNTAVRVETIPSGFSLISKFAKRIKVLGSEGYSLVHTHDSGAHTHAIIAAALLGNQTPIIVSRRVDFPIKNSPLSIWKYNHKQVKKILCVSKAIQAIMGERIKNKSVLETVYSGIDVSKFKPEYQNLNKLRQEFKIPADQVLIGNVAAIAPHKDYFTFVDAVKLLCDEGIKAHFFIIGDGPMRAEIEDYVRKNSLEERITFTGFRDDVPEVLPGLDLFLFTSETEGLGTSLLDAFASKVPVVGTAAGGAIELIINEKTGILTPVKSANKLAAGVHQVMENNELRINLVEGAYAHLQEFTKENTAARTLDIYRSISANS